MKQSAPYRTYIIRSWAELCRGSQSSAAIYRFSLEIPATGERFGFTCSEDLIQTLKAALAVLCCHRTGADPATRQTQSQFTRNAEQTRPLRSAGDR